ncbi:hypothetical protein QBC47DRAFT_394718 [Echria macrotheca]|uniref:Uncharacterized protein n=1 Tax=Echria macrotheca TaxID=438768 RepID=A0AAJ0B1Z1_9PEZI|nr:hypothetical protein QBC47DRAFT_394718 [Echria macrotheca]
MSNTGGINYAATLNAYHARHALPLPHDLVVLDSTPGSTDFFPNITRWSRAMAIGASKALPAFVPFVLTQAVAASFLGAMHLTSWLVGRVSAADFSVDAVNNPALAGLGTRRLYLYSREDDIIHWEDIEKHAARAVEVGYGVDAHVFEGTPHVGHMRAHPDRYWAGIKTNWDKVCKGEP